MDVGLAKWCLFKVRAIRCSKRPNWVSIQQSMLEANHITTSKSKD